MDQEAFPRKAVRPTFDLTSRGTSSGRQAGPHKTGWRPGDRDPREEDRYRLLEALLAAEQNMLIFYDAKDERSNEGKPPALPVQELLDVVEMTFDAPKVLYSHPLQSFSPENFLPTQPSPGGVLRAWSFDEKSLQAAQQACQRGTEEVILQPLVSSCLPPPPEPSQQLSLSQLLRCLIFPAQILVGDRLGLALEKGQQDDLPGREPMELDSLETWKLATGMKAALEAGLNESAQASRSGATCPYPLGVPGQILLGEQRARLREAQGLLQAILGRGNAPGTSLPLLAKVGGILLTGNLPGVQGEVATRLEVGGENGKRLLLGWLQLLLWTLQEEGAPRHIQLVFSPSSKPAHACVLSLPGGSDQERLQTAAEHLHSLLKIREEALLRPLPLFPRSSWSLAQCPGVGELSGASLKDFLALGEPAKLARAALRKIQSAWEGDRFRRPPMEGERDLEVIQVAFPSDYLPWTQTSQGDKLPEEEFTRLALQVYGPPLLAREDLQPPEPPPGGPP
jgi:exodeoxyribonuclease V gamma subunit